MYNKIPIKLISILLVCYSVITYIVLIPLQSWIPSISFSILLSIIFVLLTMIYKSIIDGTDGEDLLNLEMPTDEDEDEDNSTNGEYDNDEEDNNDVSKGNISKSDDDEWFSGINKSTKKKLQPVKPKPKKPVKKDTPSRPIGRPKGSTKDTLKPKPKRKRTKLI